MIESLHTEAHNDHKDPAEVLRQLILQGSIENKEWNDSRGNVWTMDLSETDDGAKKAVLTVLTSEYELVCQAFVTLPTGGV